MVLAPSSVTIHAASAVTHYLLLPRASAVFHVAAHIRVIADLPSWFRTVHLPDNTVPRVERTAHSPKLEHVISESGNPTTQLIKTFSHA